MKILIVNKFLYPKGGDAITALNTGKLLSSKGHKILYWGMQHPMNPEYPYKDYFASYVDFDKPGNLKKQIKIGVNILYSFETKRKMARFIESNKPDIVHLNNFYHQISPSILDVYRKYNIPTVMTINDWKPVCAAYTMLAQGKVCEACKGGKFYRCLMAGCIKESKAKSFLNTIEMYLHHKVLHVYNLIDVFISPSKFLTSKMNEMGFKFDMFQLPNLINLDEYRTSHKSKENRIVYFGRLSHEKGLFTLVKAVKNLGITLNIIGEGPIRDQLEFTIKRENIRNVKLLGYMTGESLHDTIRNSLFVVVPSEWYETFGLVNIEAFALGLPVIGSKIGGIPELVKDGETGLLFEPGNADDLRNKIVYLLKNSDKLIQMGINAQELVKRKLDGENYYGRLLSIYQKAIEKHI